ncbi:hypothetical protein [Sinomicrobium sp. M5D2P17]
MTKILYIILLLCFLSCNSQEKEQKDPKIVTPQVSLNKPVKVSFYEFNNSFPKNFEIEKYNILEMDNDSVYLVEEIWEKGELMEKGILKSYAASNNTFLSKILNLKESFKKSGTYGENDGGGISVKIFTTKDTIYGKLSNLKKEVPDDLEMVYNKFQEIKLKIIQAD